VTAETAVANQGNRRQLLFRDDSDYQRMIDWLIADERTVVEGPAR
jgi:hypothetical protein